MWNIYEFGSKASQKGTAFLKPERASLLALASRKEPTPPRSMHERNEGFRTWLWPSSRELTIARFLPTRSEAPPGAQMLSPPSPSIHPSCGCDRVSDGRGSERPGKAKRADRQERPAKRQRAAELRAADGHPANRVRTVVTRWRGGPGAATLAPPATRRATSSLAVSVKAPLAARRD